MNASPPRIPARCTDAVSYEPGVRASCRSPLSVKHRQHVIDRQPIWRGRLAHYGPVAVPCGLRRILDQAGTHGIENNVTSKLQQVSVLIYENGLVSALQEMPHSTMSPVKALGVDAIDLTHSLGKGGLAGFDQQVVVIVHQTPCPNRPIEALRDPAQVFEKRLAIAIVQENVLASVSPGHHMVESAFKFDSKRTAHFWIISGEQGIMHVTRPDPGGPFGPFRHGNSEIS